MPLGLGIAACAVGLFLGDLGLYAAGRTCCGVSRSAEGYVSGTSIGDATFFGRLAGRAAAQRRTGTEA